MPMDAQVLERPVMPVSTYDNERGVLNGLRQQMYAARKRQDWHAFEAAEKQYKTLDATRTLEDRLSDLVKDKMEKKSGKPTDPGGKVLDVLKKEKDSQGNLLREIFAIDGNLFGWTTDSLQGIRSKAIDALSPLQEHGVILDQNRQKILLELLIASGKSPQEISERLSSEKLQQAMEYAKQEPNVYSADTHLGIGLSIFLKGIIREDYIRRFIAPELFRTINEREFQGDPNGVETLAWQIGLTDQAQFGIHGKFPLLEVRILEKDGRIDGERSQLHLNKGNLRRWLRDRMSNLYDIDPYGAPNYFQQVQVNKGKYYSIPLEDFYHRKAEFLSSENDWLDYADELERDLQLDPWMMLYARTAWSKYDQVIGDENEIGKVLKELHYMNNATRKTFGGNMLRFLSTTPLNDTGAKNKDGYSEKDSTVGAAWAEMLLIYEHLSDFAKLKEVVGANSSFFTKEFVEKAMAEFAYKISNNTGKRDAYGFLGKEYYENFQKAFDENGRVTTKENQDNFIKLVNIFSAHAEDANKTKFVREHLLPNVIKEKHKFKTEKGEDDPHSLWMTWLLAYSWTNWTGIGANNDTSAQAYNAMTKWQRLAQYRLKMADERAGGTGNPRTTFLYKQLYVPFLWSLNTTARQEMRDHNGNIIGARDKTASEVLHELQGLRSKQLQELEYLKQQGVSDKEIEEIKKKFDTAYQTRAGELEFSDNAQRTHSADHIDRVAKLYPLVIGAKEIDFEKFTKYDPYSPGMPRFDRAAFQKEIQDEFLKPLRYAFEVYGDLNYNMKVRAPKLVPDYSRKDEHGKVKPFKFKTVWADMPLGEALFGHELLDRPEFWQRSKSGIPLRDKETGERLIDYNKVQKNKLLIWKQWALMKFAADIQQHRARYSYDIKHHPTYYQHIFEALESVPGAIWGNEYHMSGVSTPENFFNEEDMKILKAKALAAPWLGMNKIPFTNIDISEKMTRMRFYLNWIWRDTRAKEDEEGNGISIMLGMIFKDVFKGM